jgi:hypothetical protein
MTAEKKTITIGQNVAALHEMADSTLANIEQVCETYRSLDHIEPEHQEGVSVMLRLQNMLKLSKVLFPSVHQDEESDELRSSSSSVRSALEALTDEKGRSVFVEASAPSAGFSTTGHCAICLTSCQGQSRMLPCKHVFHKDCVDSWIGNTKEPTCPICRTSILIM